VKLLDRVLREWRIARATSQIPPGAEVLDVGCHDGQLFRTLGPALRSGVGLDADLVGELEGDRYRLYPGHFPDDLPGDAGPFDAVTMLAVFEHIPTEAQADVVAACWEVLKPGGVVVITVPSPLVDPMLDVMIKFRILDGMEADQHHGFVPSDLEPLFVAQGFVPTLDQTFQLGLNNLVTFTKPR
jgi:SAM-dependent methyltransferase